MPHYFIGRAESSTYGRGVEREEEVEMTDRDRGNEKKREREIERNLDPIAPECRFHDDLEIRERNFLPHATVIAMITNT